MGSPTILLIFTAPLTESYVAQLGRKPCSENNEGEYQFVGETAASLAEDDTKVHRIIIFKAHVLDCESA